MNEPWYELSGDNSDVVISTRIRLARNLKNYPFPIRMSDEQKTSCSEDIAAIFNSTNTYLSDNFDYLKLSDLSNDECLSFAELHLVSPEFINDDKHGKGLIISKDKSISIMLNEEDHIRIQSILPGENISKAFENADRIDNLISERTDIAFDERLGYLTQCPTNLGTGMRASLMMHLPALQESGSIPKITNNLSKLGITIRGSYGEGSNVTGAIYQLSNQITLGLSEKEAIDNLVAIADQIIEKERQYRKDIIANVNIQDKICRALGVLKYAKVLSSSQFMDLISLVRFGVAADLIKGISFADINKLVNSIQPHVMAGNMSFSERDFKRASLVRNALAKAE